MFDATTREVVYPALGALLATPDEEFGAKLEHAYLAVGKIGTPAGECLYQMRRELADLNLGELQELHARTFDLNPICVPYLSVHLFGEESFKRAKLMTGLTEVYRRAEISHGNELPDHIGVVLSYAARFSDEEWMDLIAYCLRAPLIKMLAALENAHNPWRYALQALVTLVNAECSEEAAHA